MRVCFSNEAIFSRASDSFPIWRGYISYELNKDESQRVELTEANCSTSDERALTSAVKSRSCFRLVSDILILWFRKEAKRLLDLPLLQISHVTENNLISVVFFIINPKANSALSDQPACSNNPSPCEGYLLRFLIPSLDY